MNHDAEAPITKSPPSPLRRNWLYYSLQQLARVVFILWFRLRVRGLEHLSRDTGALLLINHQSFLDPLVVGTPISRPLSYLARDSLFRVPVVGWLLSRTYVMPISREAASSATIKDAAHRMQQGFLVGIFPEGTRSFDGTMGEIKPGFIALARRGKVPVVPVGVAGSCEALPRNAWFVRPKTIRVVFGEPLTDDEILMGTQRGREDEFIALVRDRIEKCRREADQWRLGTRTN